MKQAILVLGMHRSGTSAMARVLSLSGGALPRRLLDPSDGNPTGHWEPREVAQFNEEVLRGLASEWYDAFSVRLRDGLEAARNGDLRARAQEILQEDYGDRELIVLKDPRISLLTRFWREVLDQGGWSEGSVIMVRDPVEVAMSLRTRQGFSPMHSALLWTSYMLAAERGTRGRPRVFVSYDHLLADWRAVLERIRGELDLGLRIDEAAAAEIAGFLDPDLKRHERPDGAEFGWKPAAETYEWFKAAAEGRPGDPGPLNRATAVLNKMWRTVGGVIEHLRSERDLLGRALGDSQAAHHESAGRLAVLDTELSAAVAERDVRASEVQELRLEASQAGEQARIALAQAEGQAAALRERDLRLAEYRKELADLAAQLAREHLIRGGAAPSEQSSPPTPLG